MSSVIYILRGSILLRPPIGYGRQDCSRALADDGREPLWPPPERVPGPHAASRDATTAFFLRIAGENDRCRSTGHEAGALHARAARAERPRRRTEVAAPAKSQRERRDIAMAKKAAKKATKKGGKKR